MAQRYKIKVGGMYNGILNPLGYASQNTGSSGHGGFGNGLPTQSLMISPPDVKRYFTQGEIVEDCLCSNAIDNNTHVYANDNILLLSNGQLVSGRTAIFGIPKSKLQKITSKKGTFNNLTEDEAQKNLDELINDNDIRYKRRKNIEMITLSAMAGGGMSIISILLLGQLTETPKKRAFIISLSAGVVSAVGIYYGAKSYNK